jgi:DNA (cytosine-5)-methyltransferase 1
MNFIELCAGCGGLSAGLIKAGLTPILLNDNNRDCCETLKLNHPNANIICADMNKINFDEYKCDLLAGGIPCQSWSQAGLQKGLDDDRGQLMFAFISIIEKIQPKMFLIENVKGLITHDGGNSIKSIITKFPSNYHIEYKLLNAFDYQVPQKRERVFIVGMLKFNDIMPAFIFPTAIQQKVVLRDILIGGAANAAADAKYPQKKIDLFKMIPQGGCWINLPEALQKEYLGKSYFSGGGKRGILYRLSMDLPSLTLLCTPSQKQTERCHPLEERPLNIKEYAKIQTFDDSYLFYGNTTSKYKQIGNAVPVKLAYHIGGAILQYFMEHYKTQIEIMADTIAADTIDPLQAYFDKISPLILQVLNRKSKNSAILFDILDSDIDIEEMKIALKIKQKQMKYGEIWQIIIGNYATMENLGVGHITGLDIINHTKKCIFEIKNRYNTDNSSSRKTNFDKLIKFKKENMEYDIIYGVINEKNSKGIQKNIEHSGYNITYLSGDKLFLYVFGDNSQKIINYVKELLAQYS